MTDAWIVGTGITSFGRDTPPLVQLVQEATSLAVRDAAIQPGDVQRVFVGNAAAGLLQGQEMIRGQVLLHDTGLLGSAIINVENACASSSTALHLAVAAVRGGACDVAMAVGAEQLAVEPRARIFATLASATDTIRRPAMRQLVQTHALGLLPDGHTGPEASPFMAHYAAKGAAYLQRWGGDPTDLARVVVRSRASGALNPKAQFRQPTTVEEVMAGRLVAPPLRLAMCSPVGNGAAALVVMSDRAAQRVGGQQVSVRATVLVSHDPQAAANTTEVAARRAFEDAAVAPQDIGVAEVHDAAASALLVAVEDLGLVAPGEALRLIRENQTGPDGRLPVNTGGGLLSRGHPIGATGCAQIVELVDQLRNRCGERQVPDARFALAHNAGGVLDEQEAVVALTVLERRR
ncbi:acetyl-CoA acetyltransferase [Branchiibius hedensis]|uniref:propanoyl-CoA C-acyltransferase n=1 Tax=Branchiibius hedensis TaxID=672460 RepID=A0A2Y9BTK0_9MICO|nr:thiolase family protein [Branchiibius hedensis]PWJ25318.1 acetyl-CoA acetyltransferase [Branchiibius hedensis]SSA34132.1 Acetyl-CoA acetyltransferase [Branchiibius hedensis]